MGGGSYWYNIINYINNYFFLNNLFIICLNFEFIEITYYKSKREFYDTWFFVWCFHNFLRIKPLNKNGAPARGATVTLTSNLRKHSKTIDAGSGYLCQMEPVAHYGIREGEKDFKVSIKWTNGKTNNYKIAKTGRTYIFKQSNMTISPSW